MHCLQRRSLSYATGGARARSRLVLRAHARWGPSLWRRRKPWCCDCAVCGPSPGSGGMTGVFATGRGFKALIARAELCRLQAWVRRRCWPAVSRLGGRVGEAGDRGSIKYRCLNLVEWRPSVAGSGSCALVTSYHMPTATKPPNRGPGGSAGPKAGAFPPTCLRRQLKCSSRDI
jgi:hypothetical protein